MMFISESSMEENSRYIWLSPTRRLRGVITGVWNSDENLNTDASSEVPKEEGSTVRATKRAFMFASRINDELFVLNAPLAVYKDQEPLFKRQRLDSTVICSGLELVTFLVFANTSQQQTLNINASVDVILKWSANSSPNSIPGFKPTADEYICKALLPREVFIDLFPHRTPLYTQEAFMEAAMKFVPQGIGGDGSADDQRREIAALLAHIDHGTFGK
ncbi:hypothetical protein AXG93_1406s1040 [Marchantia polymorpha subsp. ruderalis]|uniref:Uncharacterized protein n=1 Tax=Marchantia polymorpha subsp. ruderalis TaxID=1480154 RepID=A0A176W256_MARPO|nr:hypothetical protein AXG93_1406s1040 [Marchantia polymorpha subsp. ruderalis]